MGREEIPPDELGVLCASCDVLNPVGSAACAGCGEAIPGDQDLLALVEKIEPGRYKGLSASDQGDTAPASEAPVVQTTLDLALQRFVRVALERLIDEHRPALAMALVADVEAGLVAVEFRPCDGPAVVERRSPSENRC